MPPPPSDPARKACGSHVELVRNATTRITRCGCGQIHLHLMRNGLTVQLSSEHFRELAQGIAEADADPTGTGEGANLATRAN